MTIIGGNGHIDPCLNPGLGISYGTNTLGIDMNLTILPPVMSKKLGRLGSLTFVWQPVLEKENWIQTCKIPLKNWLCVASCS